MAKVAKRMEQVDASIVRYLAALDRADRDESDVAEARTTRIKDKIARLRQQMQALQTSMWLPLELAEAENAAALVRSHPRPGEDRRTGRFRRAGRDLAVATVERDKDSLPSELTMEGKSQRSS